VVVMSLMQASAQKNASSTHLTPLIASKIYFFEKKYKKFFFSKNEFFFFFQSKQKKIKKRINQPLV
jgi:hypothetical protein